MTIGIITFITSWAVFLLIANKKLFPLYAVTSYVAIILALTTDIMTSVYPLWSYGGTEVETFFTQLLNSFGIYFVVVYLFLQTAPKNKTTYTIIRHIFYWSIFSFILEVFFSYVGYIEYQQWWNLGFSYIADWVLFTLFYIHHQWIAHYSMVIAR